MFAIIKKELKNYFCSPIGYVVIGIFLAVFGLFFYATAIANSISDLTYAFYNTAFIGCMIMIPLITMSTISGERKNGTDQLLMTSPVSMFQLVMAKFIAAILLIFIPVVCTLIYFGMLAFFKMPNVPIYLTSALGFILLSTAYLSFGIFASSLTESPLISAIITFIFMIMATFIPSLVSGLSEISLLNLFIDFLYGQISFTAIVIFVSFTVLCLALTMVVLQRRKSVK